MSFSFRSHCLAEYTCDVVELTIENCLYSHADVADSDAGADSAPPSG